MAKNVIQPDRMEIGISVCSCCNEPKVCIGAVTGSETVRILLDAKFVARFGADLIKYASAAQALRATLETVRKECELDDAAVERIFMKVASSEGFTV